VNDEELLKKLKAGDEAARDFFYRSHRQRLYATACHFLGYQDPEAEDLVHDSFAAAFESIRRFEGRSSLYTWLNHICVNLCFARIRKRKRLVNVGEDEWDIAVNKKSLAEGKKAEEAALRMERLALLSRLLPKLGKLCETVMRLKLIEELDLVVIGKKLGVPMGTAAVRISRCQKALRAMVESMGA
jgi:RNA polymerase sigma-70 factor (ECF subfamily)